MGQFVAEAPSREPRRSWWQRNQAGLAPYLFISPFYLLFLVFFLGPSGFAFYLSLQKWTGVGVPVWAGLENFRNLADDATFWLAVRNSLFYSGVSLFVISPLALLLGVALHSKFIRGKVALRTFYFLPIVTSPVAIGLVFLLMYGTRYGMINAALGWIEIEPVDWLGSRSWSKFSVAGLILWHWVGFNMIYFLAGLQAIPQHLYDAAKVDGANLLQSFRHITLPMLRPVILFVAVIVLVGSAQIFDEPYILTAGGPADSSLSLAMYLYRVGLNFLNFGYASAIGALFFTAILVTSLILLRLLGIFRED